MRYIQANMINILHFFMLLLGLSHGTKSMLDFRTTGSILC